MDKKTISADLARQLIDAVIEKAKELGVPQTIAVLDESGQLKAFCRMDGAPLVGIEIVQNKAYTALVGMPTHEFYEFISKDPSLLTGPLIWSWRASIPASSGSVRRSSSSLRPPPS